MAKQPRKEPPASLEQKSIFWSGPVIFFLLVLGICLTAYFSYRTQANYVLGEKQHELVAIADLKVQQVIDWRVGRLAEAAYLFENPAIKQRIEDQRMGGTALKRWMELFRKYFVYDGIFLVDRQGKVLARSSAHDDTVSDYIRPLIDEAVAQKRIMISDLHVGKTEWGAHLDIIVPIFADQQRKLLIDLLVLRLNPGRFLYPLLGAWPTPSKSAETLLVRRDGEDVLFLNELRHQKGTALQLRFPIGQKDLPAAMAIRGVTGVVEGKDYRGVPVVAAIKPVPGSDWYVIAKIDRSEIYAPVAGYARMAFAVSIILIVFAWIMTSLFQRRHEVLLLQADEERLQRTLDGMLEGCQIIGFDWRYRYLNDAAVLQSHFRKEQLIGRKMTDVYPGIAGTTLGNWLRRCLEEREAGRIENEFIYPDGDRRWFELSIQPVAEGAFILSQDITERKLAEREAKEASRFLDLVIERTPNPMWIADRQGTVIRMNQALRDLLAITDQEVIGRYNVLNDAQVQAQGLMPLVESVFQEGRTVDFEINYDTAAEKQVELKRRAHLILDIVISPIFDDQGKVVYAIAQHKDVTEHRQMEQKLKEKMKELEEFYNLAIGRELKMIELEKDVDGKKAALEQMTARVDQARQELEKSERRYQALVENLNDVIFSVDTRGKIIYISPAIERVAGFPPGEVLGHNFADYIHPDDLAGLQASFASTLLGKLHPHEFRLRVKDGAYRWVRTSSRPLQENGTLRGLTGVLVDISEWKK